MYVIEYMGDIIGPFESEQLVQLFVKDWDLKHWRLRVLTAPDEYSDYDDTI